MEIALHSNMIVIRASRQSLELPWVSEFIASYKEELLFLARSVIIYHNEEQQEQKKEFLRRSCELFAQNEQLDAKFFLRAVMCCAHYPIKVEIKAQDTVPKTIDVELRALGRGKVSMHLAERDAWFLIYMHSKLHPYVLSESSSKLVLDLTTIEAKVALEKSLSRHHIFSRQVNYHYDDAFIRTLFDHFEHQRYERSYEKSRVEEEPNHKYRHYYAVLGLEPDASEAELKRSYKRMVKQHHPDSVIHLNDDSKIMEYTQRFQMIQEAYQALKGA